MSLVAMRRAAIAILSSLAMFMAHAAVMAGEPEIYIDEGGLFGKAWDYAAGGYDVVAYFDLAADAAPVAGSDDFVTTYKGVEWRFATQENLDKFIASPDAFRPQYGGYCAWAAARGYLAKGDPAAWSVYEGKLYLNYNKKIQKKWLTDIDGHIARADANWPAILTKK